MSELILKYKYFLVISMFSFAITSFIYSKDVKQIQKADEQQFNQVVDELGASLSQKLQHAFSALDALGAH